MLRSCQGSERREVGGEPIEEQKNFLREVVIKGLFGRNAVYLATKETTVPKKTGKQKAKNQPQGTLAEISLQLFSVVSRPPPPLQ